MISKYTILFLRNKIPDHDEGFPTSMKSTHTQLTPYYDDSDNDGLTDFAELTYWKSNWNGDPDGDARINILDEDADNDGVSDGFEVQAGTDPADTGNNPRGYYL